MYQYIEPTVKALLPLLKIIIPVIFLYFTFRFYQRTMLHKSAGVTRIQGDAAYSISKEKMRITREARVKGVEGEIGVAEVLEKLAVKYGTVVLHDLSMPKSSANIDHVLIQSKAVYVIDAKNYQGSVNIRRDAQGKWQLYVGRTKQTALAFKLKRYSSAIEEHLLSEGLDIKVVPLLAFYKARFNPDSKHEIEGVMVNVSGIENELMRFGFRNLKEFDTHRVADAILSQFPFKRP